MSSSRFVDVAFKATTLSLFGVTVVTGTWFAATTVKGFMHYGAASAAVKEREEAQMQAQAQAHAQAQEVKKGKKKRWG